MIGDERAQNGSAKLTEIMRSTDRLTARSIEAALAGLQTGWDSPGRDTTFAIWPTGFAVLDEVIGGGIRPSSLMLIAGAPGIGKTTFTIQMARNLARSGKVSAIYVCFEHETSDILTRLVAMEDALASDGDYDGPLSLRDVRRYSAILAEGRLDPSALSHGQRRFVTALARVRQYRERLFIVEATTHAATLAAIEQTVREVLEVSEVPVVLVVDYLQKVQGERDRDGGNAASIAEGLKDLALRHRLGVVAVSALNEDGLHTANNQVHHLLGGPVLAYEADAILLLEDKSARVSRVGYEYSPQKLKGFQDWVIVRVAKNRFGRDVLNLEFQKQFASACYVPTGNVVSDPLIDEKMYRE
jgi:replicative DNA helicase